MRSRAVSAASRAARTASAAVAVVPLTVVAALAVAVAGCTGSPATATARPSATATATATATAAPVYGPAAPDPACVAAKRAEQTLQSRQGTDQNDESALDEDFTNFAAALSAAAQRETHPATAQAMTALANDYTDLVQSQSGAAQLPDMTQVQKDGATFDKACSA
jgi:hypothetical protein